MPQKIIITALALGILLTAGTAFAEIHSASSTPPGLKPLAVIFPIAALGGCASKDACRVYCDIAANRDACYAYAQTHGLMTPAAITLARKLLTQVGPGGCQGDACKDYCNDSEHEQVCVAFAQQNGFISNDDANRRLQQLKIASTTSRLLPINAGGDRIPSSTLPQPKPHMPPPRPGEGSSTKEQSGSIFFSILNFFGI